MNTKITNELKERSGGSCELCSSGDAAIAYAVSPKNNDAIANEVALCPECLDAMNKPDAAAHWQSLAGSIWNPEPSVQALSYRLLYQYRDQSWADEIIGSVEVDEAVVHWAMTAFEVTPVHRDANGTALEQGDTVVLTQVLNVKGANFMAPKGTVVRKIRLVPDNHEQIEGKVNDQTIVILTKYVRKS